MKNQAGFLTIDFLFALIIAFGMSAILFALSFTLMVTEVTQYVAFSSARAFIAANLDPAKQKELARKKYENLVISSNSKISNFYQNGWFEVPKPNDLDIRAGQGINDKDFMAELAGTNNRSKERTIFTGVSIALEAKLLEMNIPFLGRTADQDSKTFQTRVNGILIRESTFEECKSWYEERKAALSALPSGRKFFEQKDLIMMEDNGC